MSTVTLYPCCFVLFLPCRMRWEQKDKQNERTGTVESVSFIASVTDTAVTAGRRVVAVCVHGAAASVIITFIDICTRCVTHLNTLPLQQLQLQQLLFRLPFKKFYKSTSSNLMLSSGYCRLRLVSICLSHKNLPGLVARGIGEINSNNATATATVTHQI